jgi:hypothetical protein
MWHKKQKAQGNIFRRKGRIIFNRPNFFFFTPVTTDEG